MKDEKHEGFGETVGSAWTLLVPRWLLQLPTSCPLVLCPKAKRRGMVKRALLVSLFLSRRKLSPTSSPEYFPLVFIGQNKLLM